MGRSVRMEVRFISIDNRLKLKHFYESVMALSKAFMITYLLLLRVNGAAVDQAPLNVYSYYSVRI